MALWRRLYQWVEDQSLKLALDALSLGRIDARLNFHANRRLADFDGGRAFTSGSKVLCLTTLIRVQLMPELFKILLCFGGRDLIIDELLFRLWLFVLEDHELGDIKVG